MQFVVSSQMQNFSLKFPTNLGTEGREGKHQFLSFCLFCASILENVNIPRLQPNCSHPTPRWPSRSCQNQNYLIKVVQLPKLTDFRFAFTKTMNSLNFSVHLDLKKWIICILYTNELSLRYYYILYKTIFTRGQ